MFSFDELTEEEETQIIEKIAEKIYQYKLEAPALILLETSKPISYIGTQLGKLYLTPLLPLLKDDLGIPTEKILTVFERRENIERLLQLIEQPTDEEDQWK